MSIELGLPDHIDLKPRIAVIGVGGAGGNAVNNMIAADLQGVDFFAANTDAQALAHSKAETKLQLGANLTQGLGAGSRPEVGRGAAEEAMEEIDALLEDIHMAFITAGMGGGTGTGAAPVIAERAREKGILTVGVITKPFQFEGARRMKAAEAGIEELQRHVDTLIIIPNQNLFRIANEKTTFADAFAMADEVLHSGVRGITDLMVMPGLINLDFADVRTVMNEMGKAMMGTGEADGDDRAIKAAEAAISNPLLDEVSMRGARGVIINITGGMDLTLFEVDEAANHIRSQVEEDANIIVGSAFNESLDGRMRVSVVATGIEVDEASSPIPLPRRHLQAVATSTPLEQDLIDDTLRAMAPDAPDFIPPEPMVDETPVEEAVRLDVADPEPVDTAEPVATPGEVFVLDDVIEEAPAAQAVPVTEEAPEPLVSPDAFIAREPRQVAEPIEPRLIEPDPMAEADFENGAMADTPVRAGRLDQISLFTATPEPTEDPAPEPAAEGVGDIADETRGPSLFERMTGSLRKEPTVGKRQAIATDPSLDAAPLEPQRKRGPAELGRLTPEDRPGLRRSGVGDDQLEIPAFLRRQAN